MSKVILEPMSEAQFSDFMEVILVPYVAARAAADHVSMEAAEHYARDQHARLLPDGRLTAGHHFLRIVSTQSSQSVGGVWFWIDLENKQAFLYNLTVFPRHLRSGFASDTLKRVEEMASAAGCLTLGLNVFSSNEAAIACYSKAGFSVVSKYMNKMIGCSTWRTATAIEAPAAGQ